MKTETLIIVGLIAYIFYHHTQCVSTVTCYRDDVTGDCLPVPDAAVCAGKCN